MIEIQVERDPDTRVRTLTCEGHAESGPHDQDVVCAAVSALVQLALFGVLERLSLPARFETRPGRVELTMPDYDSLSSTDAAAAAFLLDTVVIYLGELATRNPQFMRLSG